MTAVVSTTQVAPEAFVAQENSPAGAALHDTTDGLAAVPVAAHFVVVLIVVAVSVVNDPAAAVVPPIAGGLARLVTVFAVQLVQVPVRFVITPEAGVPSAGVTSVGEVAKTTLPLPVEAT